MPITDAVLRADQGILSPVKMKIIQDVNFIIEHTAGYTGSRFGISDKWKPNYSMISESANPKLNYNLLEFILLSNL